MRAVKILELADALVLSGLTANETKLYILLLTEGPLGGYEAAKISGISRSNVYNALEGLVEKGGACKIEGAAAKFMAVPAEEYCANKLRRTAELMERIKAMAPKGRAEYDGYITVNGDGRIVDKMKNMILSAKLRIYLSQSAGVCGLIDGELKDAVRRGLRVVIVTSLPFRLDGAEVYHTRKKESQVRLIADSAYVLTGTLQTERHAASCLFTKNETLVTLFKEALRNEIDLVTLKAGENSLVPPPDGRREPLA